MPAGTHQEHPFKAGVEREEHVFRVQADPDERQHGSAAATVTQVDEDAREIEGQR
ncbi:hypothetical protein LAJ19_01335 [Deinococcus taeanensis]|uniref:hypothetical protein n=1 Tax=Deinococcus taeanensis TaxID=2737050 RepID=UPI001CDD514A|nr:hypothetical protein [Deinococcus taeanensis]UBV42901.1 hypothetical protein LAJ19_01335 [Deinococcus taeanensis]